MISIISGTNRPNSNSLRVSEYYSKLLLEHGFENQILNLEQLPADFVVNDSFGSRSEVMSDIIATYVQPVEHFIFVIPEYNGSFPGVLKAFIDCLPPSDLHHKSSALVGLSSGYAGGARAMDQFTNVLNYLKVNVNYCKPKLSGIDGLIIGQEVSDQVGEKLLVQLNTLTNFFQNKE